MPMATRTLILALASFGDAALAVGPLAARRAARPDERVTLAGAAGVCEIAASLRLADEVWETGGGAAPGAWDLVRTAQFLVRARRARFDAVVDLFPRFGSMVASWLAMGGRAASSTSRYVDAFLKAKSAVQGSIDPVDRIAVLLGVDPNAAGLELRSEPESDAWVERALRAIGYRGGGPVVVVHTSGRWPLSAFAEVAARLRSGFGAWPVALDTPREAGLARQLAGALGGSVLGVTAPSGPRFIAALERASLVVTDDMSVAHLAGLGHVPAALAARRGPFRLGPRPGLRVLDAEAPVAAGASAVYDAACELMSKHRTASLFERD
jgi:ADP-heptose:LPS heptosyltransferase